MDVDGLRTGRTSDSSSSSLSPPFLPLLSPPPGQRRDISKISVLRRLSAEVDDAVKLSSGFVPVSASTPTPRLKTITITLPPTTITKVEKATVTITETSTVTFVPPPPPPPEEPIELPPLLEEPAPGRGSP
ncbi:hypothetical protein BDY24DRAFT_442107 [Mrakia frigida]|uniref:uncharacterized protein n=1 Tax=Mrakia frigida TaxID=29902 RepID=UPI003FCC0029